MAVELEYLIMNLYNIKTILIFTELHAIYQTDQLLLLFFPLSKVYFNHFLAPITITKKVIITG